MRLKDAMRFEDPDGLFKLRRQVEDYFGLEFHVEANTIFPHKEEEASLIYYSPTGQEVIHLHVSYAYSHGAKGLVWQIVGVESPIGNEHWSKLVSFEGRK